MHTPLSDDIMNETLSQRRKMNSCTILGSCKRDNGMGRLDPSSGCLPVKVMFLFSWLFMKIGRKKKGSRETREKQQLYLQGEKSRFHSCLGVVVFFAIRSHIPLSSSWQEHLFLGSDQVPALLRATP